MVVYNITLKVEPSIAPQWLQWQKEVHIPDVMATGLFDSFRFYRLLEQDETDGPTFIVQYFAKSKENYEEYIGKYASVMRRKLTDKWGDRLVAFRTLMETVQ
ncbi:MAG: DUF4286 family protein [Sphingobacteriales bacterium]|nr:DUF4286 family protein [Sphingobacteriales bacterium]MBI3717435.1 DUF4286 family protein [Sphingobacteriales bacterium]